jgi:predicted membrane protein
VNGNDKFDANRFREDLHEQIHERIGDRIRRRRAERMARRGRASGLLPGLILVALGTMILLDHMGIISRHFVWMFWPLLLILLGLVKLIEPHGRMFGVVLLVVGAIFMLHNLGLTRLSWGDIWPVVLIGVGLMLIWSRLQLPTLPPVSSGGTNTINEFAMSGAVERRVSASNFAGGSVSTTFGGVEIDFRSADIEGEEAVVYVEAIFGGIEVTVPDRWIVLYEGQSIFGGYSDETRPPLPEVPGAPPRKRLILRGRAVFGGINVKN